MSSMLQNLIAILGIVIIGGVGYYLYVSNSSLNSTTVSTANEASIQAAQFLSRLNELKTLTLDDGIFNDPRFRSLVDSRADVMPVPIGRPNPFAVSN